MTEANKFNVPSEEEALSPELQKRDVDYIEIITKRFNEFGIETSELSPLVVNQLALIERFAPIHNQHSLNMTKIFQEFRKVYNETIAPRTSDPTDIITPDEVSTINYLILTHDIGKANGSEKEIIPLVLASYAYKGEIERSISAREGLSQILHEQSDTIKEIGASDQSVEERIIKISSYLSKYTQKEFDELKMSEYWSLCHSVLGSEVLSQSASLLTNNEPLKDREKLAAYFAELHHILEGRLPLDFQNIGDLKEFLDLSLHSKSKQPNELLVGNPIDNSERIANLLSIILLLDKFEAGINRSDWELKDENINVRMYNSINRIMKILDSTSIDEESGLAGVISAMLKVYNNSEFRESVSKLENVYNNK